VINIIIWIRDTECYTNFLTCPKDDNNDVVQRYARAWLWHMVARFLFSNRSGNIISWMVLQIL
jgi:hypothetical protein